MDDRVPPHDLDAEAAVLSVVLAPPFSIAEAREWLSPADFYSDANRRVFDAACAIDDAGGSPDTPAVAGWLQAHGRLRQIGGSAYLLQLVEGTPAVSDVAAHCRAVSDKARVRRLILAGQTIVAEGYGTAANDPGYPTRAEQLVFEAAESGAQLWPTESIGTIANRIYIETSERRGSGVVAPRGVALPWRCMTSLYPGGLELGKIHVVAARPGQGKSSFVSELLRTACTEEHGGVLVSLEMTREEVAARIIAAESEVPHTTIQHGEPSAGQWSLLTDGVMRLARLPIAICYRPGATVAAVRGAARREAARLRADGRQLRLLGVDYLQLMGQSGARSREEAIATMSRELVALAGELDVALILVSQLNRECDKRPNRRPQLSDLAESGAIERDAFSVLFLYRDEYYNRDTDEPGICEVNVAKHRSGPSGMRKMRFRGELCRFDGILDEEQAQYDSFDDPDDADRWHP